MCQGSEFLECVLVTIFTVFLKTKDGTGFTENNLIESRVFVDILWFCLTNLLLGYVH